MKNKVKFLGIALTLAVVLALSIGTATFAAGPAATTSSPTCGLGYGNSLQSAVCQAAISELLGMTRDEIHALRLEGKSLVEIAAAKNVTEEQLVAAIMEAKTEALQTRVADGKLTQEQADLMLQNMEQNTIEAMNRVTMGPAEGKGSANGAGYRNGYQSRVRTQTADGTCTQTGTATRAGKMYGKNR